MNLIVPKKTEKAYTASNSNVYVFDVPLRMNKHEIAQTVAVDYDVRVLNVRTVIQAGKTIRYSRKRGQYPGETSRSDQKKAYVTIAEGGKIPVFDEIKETK